MKTVNMNCKVSSEKPEPSQYWGQSEYYSCISLRDREHTRAIP